MARKISDTCAGCEEKGKTVGVYSKRGAMLCTDCVRKAVAAMYGRKEEVAFEWVWEHGLSDKEEEKKVKTGEWAKLHYLKRKER